MIAVGRDENRGRSTGRVLKPHERVIQEDPRSLKKIRFVGSVQARERASVISPGIQVSNYHLPQTPRDPFSAWLRPRERPDGLTVGINLSDMILSNHECN